MATRKQVAEKAGVSVATVSYVMNHTKNVTPEVKKRVQQAIKELDYRPNLIARGLATRQTQHVAMFVDNLKNVYYSEMLAGAQSVASDYGYIVSIIIEDSSNSEEVLQLTSRGVDGVILAKPKTQQFEEILGEQFPCCTTGEYVTVDYQTGIYEAVKSLKDKGHRNIAYLSGLRLSSPVHDRYRSLRNAFSKYGIKYDERLFIDGNEKEETDENAGRMAVRELVERKVPFTAIFTTNDLMAIGAMAELHDRGVKVPEDVSIVGCDNIKMSEHCIPTLSTLDVNAFGIGQCLMKSLYQQINHKEMEHVVFTAHYIERNSVAQAKKD